MVFGGLLGTGLPPRSKLARSPDYESLAERLWGQYFFFLRCYKKKQYVTDPPLASIGETVDNRGSP